MLSYFTEAEIIFIIQCYDQVMVSWAPADFFETNFFFKPFRLQCLISILHDSEGCFLFATVNADACASAALKCFLFPLCVTHFAGPELGSHYLTIL